jgi:hypothetical protein
LPDWGEDVLGGSSTRVATAVDLKALLATIRQVTLESDHRAQLVAV